MSDNISMNPNPIVQYLNKHPEELTKADLIKYIEDNDIEMINFRYVGWDGRLKTLNFFIGNRKVRLKIFSRRHTMHSGK